jgi:hypothetical protein
MAFNGCFLLGLGFTFDDAAVARGKPASPHSEIATLIEKNPRNAERILPFLGSEEVNTDPRHTHRRSVIDFNDFPLGRRSMQDRWATMSDRQRASCRATGLVPDDYPDPVAEDWPDLLDVLRRLVKPERNLKKGAQRDAPWWLYFRPRPAMRAAVANLPYFFVTGAAMVTHHLFAQLSGPIIPSHKLTVIASDDVAIFGQLQSSVHELWSATFGATAGSSDAITYNPKNVFLTFPFAPPAGMPLINLAAQNYLSGRTRLMIRLQRGLTSIYNAYHDYSIRSDAILELRDLHLALDQAVLCAYGWNDLAARAVPMFLTDEDEPEYRYQGRLFWNAALRDEVLSRLLALNAERHKKELAAGLVPSSSDSDEETDDAMLETEEADA